MDDKCFCLAVSPAPIVPVLDERAQRLTALQATALALQSRLQSHALRLSGTKEGAVPQPVEQVSAQPQEMESGFQGVLPGVANIRKQAGENEKQVCYLKTRNRLFFLSNPSH
jgi:hypothetical protein